MFAAGVVINQRYRLEDEIGRGGTGIAYSAYDTLLERRVAVKLLHTTGLGSEGRANLLREAQIIANLNHPNIITVYDAGEVGEAPYLVMELIDGEPLDRFIPLPIEKILAVAIQICSALEYAHQHGIVHRDLKPGNIFLERNGQVKLMDFGLARSIATRITAEGTITGTVFYMAPEQALGKAVDARTDLYSLGVILYELTTGDVPFTGDEPLTVITQHLYAPVVPPQLKNEATPAALDNLILRLLSKEPGDRPESAAAVLNILEQISTGEAAGPVQAAGEVSILDRIVRGRMVARQPELAEAEKLWARAKSGERQVLLISGEPGIGKTRLMQEIVTRVEVSGGLALLGESYAEGGTPYASFAQIARSSLQVTPSKVSFPEYVLADLLLLAPDLRVHYAAVQPNPPLDPKAEQARLFENMVAWCQLICEKKPLLIGLEDAHWADSGSLSLFHHLARRTRKLPILFVLTYREVELDEQLPLQGLLVDLNRERFGTNLKLKRLDERGTEALLATLFAEEVTPEFLAGIYQATEGNPFFIQEVCKALVENGEVYYQDGRWQRHTMDAIQIPQSVRLAIQSRLGKLPEEGQEVLRMAALIGREFEIEILQEASGLAEDRLIGVIEAAEDSQFIQELSASDGLTYRFTHALFPATLAEGIHTLRRRRMHRQVAEALQRLHPDSYEALAYHFTEGGDDQQAYSCHVKAGRKAAAAFANAEAEDHFLAALFLVEKVDEKASLLVELAEARILLGKYHHAKDNFLSAAEIYTRQNNLDQAAISFGFAARAIWEAGDTPASLELALKGLEAVAGLQDGRGLASLLSETGRECYFNGRTKDAIWYIQSAMEIAERGDYPDVLCDTLITMAILSSLSEEKGRLLERAVVIAERAGLYHQLVRALYNLIIVYGEIGDFDRASACAKRGIEAARRRNDLPEELYLTIGNLYWIMELGKYDEARELFLRVHQLCEALPPDLPSQRMALMIEGSFLNYTGQVEQGRKILENVHRSNLEAQDLQYIAWSDWSLADIYLQMKEYDRLKQVLEEGLKLHELLLPRDEDLMLTMQVIVFCREGQVDQAAQILEELTSREKPALASNYYNAPASLATAEIALARQEWERAWAAFADAVEGWRLMLFPTRQGFVLREWAAGLQRRGEPADLRQARQLLQEALDIYTRLDVAYYVEQVKRQMKEIHE